MYTSYFGLNEIPFSIAPDPLYLYMSEQHREALAHLQYGIKRDGGFVLLTGEVGAGKTTLCRSLLEQLPEGVDVAFVLNPKVSAIELLETICDELRIDRGKQGSIKNLVDRLNTYLLEANARGRKTVLFIDEAQNLSLDVLEQLRLLTNLETNRYKLLQIVLLGQPELLSILNRQEMRQFSQRITARYHLGPLDAKEMDSYVRHRLEIAGCDRLLFPEPLSKTLWHLSGGIPRLINLICDRALLGAYTLNRPQVNRRILRQAAREVLGRQQQGKVKKAAPAMALAALVILLCIAAFWYWMEPDSTAIRLPFGAGNSSSAQTQKPVLEGKSPEVAIPSRDGLAEALPRKWPEAFAASRSMEGAFADLAGLWGLSYNPDRPDYCSYASEYGLDCLVRKDSLETLRKMNRPAILTLHGENGAPFHVVMSRLEGNRAIFIAGGKQFELAFSAIASHWVGEYLLLWHGPPLQQEVVAPGETGASVAWLAKTLQELGFYEITGQEVRLDGPLLDAFKRFQVSNGLTPDGVLGPMTLAHLNTARNLAGPHLSPLGAS
ncbi:MAG: ExeA family protein [Desulfurivibrionaceae bacterium]|jgi:general secretion pathway protein A|nr:AAA family ATPase [Pseudomonadota bacterium]